MLPVSVLDLHGVAALAALLALPGLLVVRAPWQAVPFLSSAFWILSWWWLGFFSPERERFLWLGLCFFGAISLLRLLKPLGLRRPGWPVFLVLAASVARLMPFFLWPVTPGVASSRQAMLAQLLAWRDGIPVTFEPLLSIPAFGTPACGLASLATDISLLSGLPVHRSALLVSTAAMGLLQLALFTLLARFFPASVAALASVVALALAALPQGLLAQGDSPSLLALALVTAAAAVLARARSRSRAVAAGWLLAAGLACSPAVIAGGVLCLPLLALEPDAGQRRRALLAIVTVCVCAAPFLFGLRLLPMSAPGDVGVGIAFLLFCAGGLALAMKRGVRAAAALAGAAGLLLVLADAFAAPAWAALAALLLAAGLAHLAVALPELAPVTRAGALAVVSVLAVDSVMRSYDAAGAAVAVSADDLRAMEFLAEHTRALDVVCNEPGAGAWIPAIAGRGITAPVLDAQEASVFRPRPCVYRYGTRPTPSDVFRAGAVAIAAVPE